MTSNDPPKKPISTYYTDEDDANSPDDLELKKAIDRISNDFEDEWTKENPTDFVGYLDQIEEKFRQRLLFQLLEVEVELLQQNEQEIDPESYEKLGYSAVSFVRGLIGKDAEGGDSGNGPPPSNSISSNPPRPKLNGPYKLLQLMGEGGMGAVWMAEQYEPVRRKVAIKLIRTGMGSKEAIARFEAERQALAMMDHPNIAKVLDAGNAEDGCPYFVMELVHGIPITDYCDKNKLDISERLKLTTAVCSAIQHAHQKGIIHRDIKPSNVLVADRDGQRTPKVIDFGLAKALEHTTHLTDKTVFTEFGRVVGTLQYMSPEQAEMDVLNVDTRTDVYSLGVLIFQLLTGSTPLDEQTAKQQLFQVLQYIKENETPRPSARLSSMGNSADQIGQNRQINPVKLQTILKGELDWIVMKALEKDRSRRYESASELANDIERYLGNEPVLARPPSRIYKIKKFVQKNSAFVFASSLIVLLLIAGVVGTSIGFMREKTARQTAVEQTEIARTAKQQAEDNAIEATRLRLLAEDREKTSLALVSFFENDLLKFANPWNALSGKRVSGNYSIREVLEMAAKKFPPDGHKDSEMPAVAYCSILMAIGDIYEGLGDHQKAESYAEGALNVAKENFSDSDPTTIKTKVNLGFVKLMIMKRGEGINHFTDVFFVVDELVKQAAQENATAELKEKAILAARTWLSAAKSRMDFSKRTLPVWDSDSYGDLSFGNLRLLSIRTTLVRHTADLEKLVSKKDEIVLYCRAISGFIEFGFKEYNKAEKTFRDILTISENRVSDGTLPNSDPGLQGIRQTLAMVYRQLNKLPEKQIELATKVHEVMHRQHGINHPATMTSLGFLASTLQENNKVSESVPLLLQRKNVYEQELGLIHPRSVDALFDYLEALRDVGELEKSEQIVSDRMKLFANTPKKTRSVASNLITSMYRLGMVGLKQKKLDFALRCIQKTYEFESAHYPDDWSTFDTQSNLGEIQVKNNNSEKGLANLKAGYEGLQQRYESIPVGSKNTLKLSIQRLIRFYERQKDESQVDHWKEILKKAE